MTQRIFALTLGFGAVILATQVAHAASHCDARDRVVALLAERYGETRRSVGIAGDDAVMELFAAEETGTWTITVTLPDGQTCLMASGVGYEALSEELPAKGTKV
jgi:hypothetical protein